MVAMVSQVMVVNHLVVDNRIVVKETSVVAEGVVQLELSRSHAIPVGKLVTSRPGVQPLGPKLWRWKKRKKKIRQ